MTMDHAHLKQISERFPVGNITGIRRLSGGITNDTYLVTAGRGRYVLQRLHDVFGPEVLADTDAVTAHLHAHGLVTPRLVRTADGSLGASHARGCWRMLTYVPGRCYRHGLSSAQSYSAGRLVGRFHRTLSGLEYRFGHRLPEFHDTEAKMMRLTATLHEFRDDAAYTELKDMADIVLDGFEKVAGKLKHVPARIVHGDPKVSNVRFSGNGENAVSLIDLDTIGRHAIAVELGDAARSWCNRAPEGDVRRARFDLRNFRSMMAGYRAGADGFAPAGELAAVPAGVETITLELAARFITDAFRRTYFKLEPDRFRDLGQQNRLRAASQVSLYRDFISKRARVTEIINET